MPSLKRYPICLVLLGLLLAATPALAQFDTATVTLTNLDTGVSAVKISDGNGSFEFVTVRVGHYKVTAELQGFSVALAPEFQVQVGARQRVELSLAPGQLTETVEVRSAATRLETDSSQRGQVVTAEQIVELPLNGREYSGLVLLSPGVGLSTLNTGSATPREGSFNINGLRSRSRSSTSRRCRCPQGATSSSTFAPRCRT